MLNNKINGGEAKFLTLLNKNDSALIPNLQIHFLGFIN